jgi:hypothetical protein
VLVAVVFIAFVALVALLSWRGAGKRVRITTCCSARPWPPDDLTGAFVSPPASDTADRRP